MTRRKEPKPSPAPRRVAVAPSGATPERAGEVFTLLEALYPQARIALAHRTPYELLVAVILSAQCTDARVNLVTPALFSRFPDAGALAAADQGEVEALIRTCGLFRNKARNLIAASRHIELFYGGAVPTRRAELVALPGVGDKTAGVVSMHLSGEPALPVDTHVARLAWRLGLTSRHAPSEVERDLTRLLPPEKWIRAHHLLIWHGRGPCDARKPTCEACGVADLCPKIGVERSAASEIPRGRRARPGPRAL